MNCDTIESYPDSQQRRIEELRDKLQVVKGLLQKIIDETIGEDDTLRLYTIWMLAEEAIEQLTEVSDGG